MRQVTGHILCLSIAHCAAGQNAPLKISRPNEPRTLSSEEIQPLIRAVAENDIANDLKQRDYTYLQREEEHKLDGQSKEKSLETRNYEIMMLYGQQVRRLIARNDKPLSAQESAKEEKKIQEVMRKREQETPEQREKRLQKEVREREEQRAFVREIADAYTFRLVGTETRDGREAYTIDANPRAGFHPHLKDAKYLPKFRGRIWIDSVETQWVKLDIEAIDTVSWGLFLARLHKGSRISIELTRVNDEVWLPKSVSLKLSARVALLKSFNVIEDVSYRDYKKFRSDTKIVPVTEAEPR
ncbi:MAG TPA: hypothetical protein VES66_05065 [Terriglobales bacterium]|nr:hypothetical protein [Terriglobales bacterium]